MASAFHLAVGQSPANLSSVEERLSWLETYLPQVSQEGADLLLLPELFASGYNIGEEVVSRAEPADGPAATAIRTMAMTYGVAIHYGYPELDGEALFNSAQCFGADGSHLGSHRKLILPPGFERAHFTPGKDCTQFTYRGVRIATLICYDAEFPEAARHVATLGAQLLLVPTALGSQWEWVAQKMIPTRAFENGIYLGYANSVGTERGMEFLGQSLIANPDGQEMARAGTRAEVIFGVLEPQRVAVAQARLPYLTDRSLLGTDFFRS